MPPKPLVLAILNVSLDSFSGDGSTSAARGWAFIRSGADWLDVGGESTRPGAETTDPLVEQTRVLPLIRDLAASGIPISVDTRNASTMEAALDAGAGIVNDVSGLTYDPAAAPLVARRGCRVVIMHSRGTPQTMAALTQYGDLVAEVKGELGTRIEAAGRAGVRRENIIIDPGIGFAKTAEQNLELLRRLGEFQDFGLPILVGVSRKSFIGRCGGEPDAARRGPGSIAAALWALSQGASILRVHDVAETVQALRVWQTLSCGPK